MRGSVMVDIDMGGRTTSLYAMAILLRDRIMGSSADNTLLLFDEVVENIS